MSRTDLIADVFTMLRNAALAKKQTVDVPSSRTVVSILEILKNEGYIENYKTIEDNKQGIARIYLKYIARKPAIRAIQRVSKPSARTFARHKEVPTVLRGRGLAILSTSKGLITDRQARESGVGGEIVAYIW
jgi:small subunit ribosomal protein S8